MNRIFYIFFLIVVFFSFNGCDKKDPCTCVGVFRLASGNEFTTPDVDCETGSPGALDQSTLNPIEAEFLGCQP